MKDIEHDLKVLIIDALSLEDVTADQIDSNEPLFGEGLGLDSIDALELGIALRKKYELRIPVVNDEIKAHFATVSSLAHFIKSQRDV